MCSCKENIKTNEIEEYDENEYNYAAALKIRLQRLSTNSKNFMKSAVKKPGAFIAYARSHGGLDSDGLIKKGWAKSLIGDDKIPEKVRERANLYLEFMAAQGK